MLEISEHGPFGPLDTPMFHKVLDIEQKANLDRKTSSKQD